MSEKHLYRKLVPALIAACMIVGVGDLNAGNLRRSSMANQGAGSGGGPAPDPILGDYNLDCVVDVQDLTAVLGAFGTDNPGADMNNDGIVDDDDVNMVNASWGFTCGLRLTGDVDGDGVVGVVDLNRVLGDWGTSQVRSDLNEDQTVGQQDLDLVEANWGRRIEQRLHGDHTGDDLVDVRDLTHVLASWGGDDSQVELDLVLALWDAKSGTDLLGDINGDKVVDDRDLALVQAAWNSPFRQADLDSDGSVGVQDLIIVNANFGNTAGTELSGDINGDWIVDGADQAQVLARWGSDHAQADVTGDGTVDVQDLVLVNASFGETYGQALVGDINGDCEVGPVDQQVLTATWGLTTFPQADVNADGQLDVVDLTTILANWGSNCP